ncbi:MAG: histidine phosphatase family protein [Actinomycetota bacterium]|nr:histidine phosphatase family protein [Actinomycetota bacterium]
MSSLQCETTMILARHGDAAYESRWLAEVGGSLTELGRRQASALGEALVDRRVAHVWTSTLARAVQTAEIVAARLGVGVTTRESLREFGCGDLAGTDREIDPFVPIFRSWLGGDLAARIPGGESGEEMVGRMRGVLSEIADAHPGETVLVVSHGGLMKLGVPHLVRMDSGPERIGNCSTIELAIDADDWVCRSWNAPGEV